MSCRCLKALESMDAGQPKPDCFLGKTLQAGTSILSGLDSVGTRQHVPKTTLGLMFWNSK